MLKYFYLNYNFDLYHLMYGRGNWSTKLCLLSIITNMPEYFLSLSILYAFSIVFT